MSRSTRQQTRRTRRPSLPQPVDVRYSVDGEGEPVIWAGGISALTYGTLRSRFPKTVNGRKVISFLYREPQDAAGQELEQSTAAFASDVVRILDRAGIAAAHVIGSGGMGAMVMTHVGISAPERVISAALVQGAMKLDVRTRWITEACATLRRHSTFRDSQRLMMATCHSREYLEAHQEEMAVQDWASIADPDREAHHMALTQAITAHDVTETIYLMTAPTLVVTGDETDPMLGTWAAEAMHARLANSELVVIAGAPHAITESRALLDELDCTLDDFLARHTRASRP